MAKDKLEEYRTKATIIIALASIVTAIVAVASARTYLFPLIVYGSFVFLFVALVVIVWPFSVRPVFIFSKNKIKIWKHNRLSKNYFDEFKEFVTDFENFCGRKNPVGVLIRNLIHDDKYFKEFSEHLSNDYNESLRHGYLPDTFNLFKKRVNKFNGTKEDFLLLVGEFENLLDIYKALFIDKLLRAVEEVGKDKVHEKLKEKYSEFRDYYNDFMRRYKVYGKKVNYKFGEEVVGIDFDIAKEL
jgi:hypothetical protein